jgi:hypothetical protein
MARNPNYLPKYTIKFKYGVLKFIGFRYFDNIGQMAGALKELHQHYPTLNDVEVWRLDPAGRRLSAGAVERCIYMELGHRDQLAFAEYWRGRDWRKEGATNGQAVQ